MLLYHYGHPPRTHCHILTQKPLLDMVSGQSFVLFVVSRSIYYISVRFYSKTMKERSTFAPFYLFFYLMKPFGGSWCPNTTLCVRAHYCQFLNIAFLKKKQQKAVSTTNVFLYQHHTQHFLLSGKRFLSQDVSLWLSLYTVIILHTKTPPSALATTMHVLTLLFFIVV